MRRYILLNPGPVNIKERVRRTLLVPDMCHREPEFGVLLSNCRRKILKAFGIAASFDIVFFSSSGTAALEAAVISLVPEGKKILVINNGVYAARIAAIATSQRLGLINLKLDITRTPDIHLVEKELKKHKDIAVVAMVHHETSTGLLNPIHEIGRLCKKHKLLYLLDSISALGGEEIDFRKVSADLCVGTANKCIESIPGVSFVLVRKSAIGKIKKIRARSVYLDILSNLNAQKRKETLFTPAVQAFYALNAALDELIKEGVKNRIKRYKALAIMLRRGFEQMRIRYLIPSVCHSNTITALYLPKGLSYRKLHEALKKKGFIIYAGQSKLKGVIFRVANMGQLRREDMRRFLAELKRILAK